MIGLCPLSVNFFFKGHLLQTTGPIVKLLHMNVPHNALYVVYHRVPTQPGKREKSGNLILVVHGYEKSGN